MSSFIRRPAETPAQFDETKHGPRCVAALAGPAAVGALPGLLPGIDRQNGVADRHAERNRRVHQPVIGVVADHLEMERIAADDTADGDHAVEAAAIFRVFEQIGLGRSRHHLRNFQRAGNAHPLEGAAARFQFLDGPCGHRIGDILVETAFHDENPRVDPLALRAAAAHALACHDVSTRYSIRRVPTICSP